MIKTVKILLVAIIFSVFFCVHLPASDFNPPENIISKKRLEIDTLNFIRTKSGKTYLISPDGRYVFQGELFDVWNGKRIKSMGEMKALSDKVNLEYLGVDRDKLFTLNMGSGPKEIFIFADPSCSVCHKLLREIRDSKLIRNRCRVRAVIIPALSDESLEKSKKLVLLARRNQEKALTALIEDSFDAMDTENEDFEKLQYNLLVSKAMSIRNFPYLINSKGRIQIGMPDDIYSFLLEN